MRLPIQINHLSGQIKFGQTKNNFKNQALAWFKKEAYDTYSYSVILIMVCSTLMQSAGIIEWYLCIMNILGSIVSVLIIKVSLHDLGP